MVVGVVDGKGYVGGVEEIELVVYFFGFGWLVKVY